MNNSCIAYIGLPDKDEYWLENLSRRLASYGPLKSTTENDIERLDQLGCRLRMVIVDSGYMTNVIDVVARIRKTLPSVKILVVSASPVWKEVRQVIYAGADDYCQKTLDGNGILEHVERLVGKYPKRGGNE